MKALLLALLVAQDKDRVDVHVHLHRVGGQPDFEGSAKRLVERMDRLGIAKALILPPPAPADVRRETSHRDYLEALRRHPGRLYFLDGGGTLNPMIQKYAPDRVTPEVRAEFARRAEEIVKAGARGFGEMTALHLSIHDGHPFEEVSPDHPLFLLLAELAAKHDVPIDLHMDAIPEDMDFPAHLRRIQERNPARLKGNLPAFERLLAHDRRARIVWQHASSDPVAGMSVETLRRFLRAHENLFVALRVPFEDHRQAGGPRGNALLGPDGELRKDWLELLTEFPDRFVVGSDFFAGLKDDYGGTRSLEGAWSFVGKLPTELAKKVGGANAMRVYGLE